MQINKIQPTTFGQKPILKQMKYKLGLAGMLLSELGYVAKDIFVHRKKFTSMLAARGYMKEIYHIKNLSFI